ncbi:uncharacterized protein ASCRUDRAFT_16057, partial [Ascoidea rubescens DSM 1968]
MQQWRIFGNIRKNDQVPNTMLFKILYNYKYINIIKIYKIYIIKGNAALQRCPKS